MSGWLFSQGRVHETAISTPLAAGAGICSLAGADTLFAPGDLLFASPTPGGGATPAASVQWLGRVTSVTSSTLSFSLPPRAALPSGSHLWRAAGWLDLPVSGAWHGATNFAPPIYQAVALSGAFFTQQIGPATQRAELRLSGIPQLRFQQWRTWFASSTASGALPFALITPEQRILLCRFAPATATGAPDPHGRLALQWAAEPGGGMQLTLPLFILGTEQYA